VNSAIPVEREATRQWFGDAKFGLFVHWGVYALLGKGEWIRTTGKIPRAEYAKLQRRFNPKRFNPDAWADLAKRAGTQYVVFTTKHLDGFCMFDAHNTDWKVTRSPYGRDVLAEVTQAFEKQGLRVGYYYCIWDCYHDEYLPRLDWEKDSRPAAGHDVRNYVPYLREHVRQLLTEYGSAPFVLWWDAGNLNTPEELGAVETNALARRLRPDILINDRHFTREDLVTPEQRIPPTGMRDESGQPVLWEACVTMTSLWWGYDRHETVYKTSAFLIRMLVDIVSKGGNLLLNVGPKPDGTIQKEFRDRLAAIGRWMDTYSEAIYGTTASPFNLLPFYGRVTTKGNRLYVHVFEWPADQTVRLPNLRNHVKQAWLLAKARTPLAATRAGSDWVIALPARAPDRAASVLAVELDGVPHVDPFVIRPDDRGVIRLPALYGALEGPHGQRIRYESRDGVVHAGNWIRPSDGIEWSFATGRPGLYRVLLEHAVQPGQGGAEMQVVVNGVLAARLAPNGLPYSSGDADMVGGEQMLVSTRSTGGQFRTRSVGHVTLADGANTVKLVLRRVRRQQSLDLRGVVLKPVSP
jgi:alpha-L-fucosidase